MSQQRMRKASAATEAPRARPPVKAAGDSSAPNPNRQHQPRSRSKNKIPKNIRYDLDNALVGLCDVWFEDIKPHLIRNNIKVHIHSEGSGPGSGDHQRVPPGAPGCSHYDPGAASDRHRLQCVNFADSYATRPTASQAPCHRPLAPPTSPLQLLLQSLSVQQECKLAKQRSRSQKSHTMQQQLQPQHHPQPHPHPQNYQRREPPVPQTHNVLPSTHCKSRYRDMRSTVPSCKKRDVGSQTAYSWPPFPVTVYADKETQTSRPSRKKSSARVASSLPASCSPAFDRCPGKTTLLPSRLKARRQLPSTLFNESLIDDVKKVNPKLIQVLFKSPHSSIFNSSITLLETPKGKRKRKNAGKKPPWR